MRHRDLAAVVLTLAGATGVLAQESEPVSPQATPSFPTRIDHVVVDVVVTDEESRPVTGLTREDLVVRDDGVPQTITTFEAVELPVELAAAVLPPPPVSTNTGPGRQRGRTFVIVFDDVHITPYRARAAKAAVASFLDKGVREGDSVSVIASGGGAWWTARMNAGRAKLIEIVKRLEGRHIPNVSNERMTELEALRIHVYRDPQVADRVLRRYVTYGVVMGNRYGTSRSLRGTTSDPFVAGKAADVYAQSMTRKQVTLDTLERALLGLVGTRGRKSVILISEGFVFDPNLDGFRRVQEAARRANAAIYFVNARGLDDAGLESLALFGPAPPPRDTGVAIAESLEATGGADGLALDSGGFTVRNTNNLSRGIQRIADETRVYYLLGYEPTSTANDGRFHEIEVELRDGRGRKVRARKGYYAPLPEGQRPPGVRDDVDPVLQAAIDSPWATDEIPLRMTAYVAGERTLGRVRTEVVTEVDIRDLDFDETGERHRAEAEYVLMVTHRETGESFTHNHTINMNLRPSTRERFNRVWFPIARDLELQPGDHQAKMVVRDNRTGTAGSVIHEFAVPPPEGFRVSSPILTDTRKRNREGKPGQALPLARREFPQGAPLFCQFEVFGAARGEDGMPRVMQGFEVRGADGRVQVQMPEAPIIPTSLGHLFRLLRVPLEDTPLGEYEMRISLRDELGRTTLEVSEPFTVVPSSRPTSATEDVARQRPAR